MPELTDDLSRHITLRQRAALRVSGAHSRDPSVMSPSAALGVLHRLASSPATATEALALLHELQVYQVELELQDEELRAARVELETLVIRHRQLYDGSPAGSFTIDRETVITELNLAGARLMGSSREAAIGRRFDSMLAGEDKQRLQTLLSRAATGEEGVLCELRLRSVEGGMTRMVLTASVDPAGARFLLAAFAAGDTAGI